MMDDTMTRPNPMAWTQAPTAGDDLRLAQAGDTRAFDRLVRAHERLVYGVARRLLNRFEDAQEASQEVFLRFFRHLDHLDPSRPLEPWLYRVTTNVCHDLGRGVSRRRAMALDDAERSGDLPHAPRSSDPAVRSDVAEEYRILEDALATLGERERAALVLRDIEGLSTDEVAEVLGSSPVTVRSQICRARLKIHRFRQSRLEGESHGL